MGKIGVIPILVLIAGFLHSEHGANGQVATTLGEITSPLSTQDMNSPERIPLETTPPETTPPETTPPETTPPEATPPETTPPETTPQTMPAETPTPEGITKSTTLIFESTTTLGAVISDNACPSYQKDGEKLCSSVTGVTDIEVFLTTGTLSNACRHSMLQYGCASLVNFPASTITTILRCFISNSNAVTSQESFSLIISQLDMETLEAVINDTNNLDPSSIPENNKQYLLNAVWERLHKDPENMNPCVLSEWFHKKLYPLIPKINNKILNCMVSLPMTCEALEAVVGALDVAYSKLDQVQREDIGLFISRFIKAHSCSQGTPGQAITLYFKSFVNNVNIISFIDAFSTTDFGSAIDAFTFFQLAQYVNLSKSLSTYETASPVLQLLETKDLTFVVYFLENLNVAIYDQKVLYSLLHSLLIKINRSDDPLCQRTLGTVFNGKLSYLFRALNSSILDLIVPKDCSDFQAVYQAIDVVYFDLSEDIQQLVFQSRMKFLNSEVNSSGSACTYGLTSSEWLQKNLGKSSNYFSYTDIMRLNFNFNGFEALSFLSFNQTMDLITEAKLFTSESPPNYETHIKALVTDLTKRELDYIQRFLVKLKNQIKFIVNINVRYQFLEGIWEKLERYFIQFTANDWYIWWNEYLYIFLPSITTKQLSVLSYTVVGSCTNMQTIVGGFNNGFDDMSDETKSEVAKWIIGFLSNSTDKCLGDNWLNVNFLQFKAFINFADIRELNPDFKLLDSLKDLTAAQIGEGVVTETTALSNVTFIEIVFIAITNSSQSVLNLGNFWESFNLHYKESVKFTDEVKYKMLEMTVDEISVDFDKFTADHYFLWFEMRLSLVIQVINRNILEKFPMNADCDSYKAFVHSLSVQHGKSVKSSKADVFTFLINFLEKGTKCSDTEVDTVSYIEFYFGSYSVDATYEQLITYYPTFNPFEVLEKLTEIQIGDMIVVANVFENLENTRKVFEYLQTLSVERVDSCMAQFTATAIKKNISIVDVNVGQYILQSYLNIIKTSLSTYTNNQITQLFQLRISILIKFFKEETLNLFSIQDCDTLVVVVALLDQGFSGMSGQTKTVIAYWIFDLLQSSRLNGCTSFSSSSSVWVDTTFKRFFASVSLKKVQEVYPSLDILEIINSTSISQKVEYLTSSQEILQSVEITQTVLESMSGSDNVVSGDQLYIFLDEFNKVYGEIGFQMSVEVRQTVMTFLFTSWISDLGSFTSEEISQFGAKFKYFLAGIRRETVIIIPFSISCNIYEAIFSAFSSVLGDLSDDVARFIFDTIINYLNAQYDGSSDVCGSLYNSTITYVQYIFFDFLKYATFYELELYYREFNVYEILYKLSGQQLGNLFINSTAIQNELEAVQILVELGKRGYTEISSFMSECTKLANEKNIKTLPDSNIQYILYLTVWNKIAQNLKTSADFSYWFSINLQLIISSVSTTAIETLIVNDCDSQRHVVGAFSKAYGLLDKDQRNSVFGQITGFNKKQKNTKETACGTDSESSVEWIEYYYGPYVVYAKLQELQEYNANLSVVDTLNVLSGEQVADYAIQSQAFRSEEAIVVIFNSLDSTQKVQDFLGHLNDVAADDLKQSAYAGVIISKTFEIISDDFLNFKQEDWALWTQNILQNILFSISATDLQLIPFPLSCASYQEIISGLNNVFDKMTEETKQAVYDKCIQPQLNNAPVQNGARCGQQSQRSQEWVYVNFGEFSIYANITVFASWNINFKITEVIQTLSIDQLAEVAVEEIDQEDIACQVAGRVQELGVEDVYIFLDTFYTSFQFSNAKITNIEIGYKFLSASISAIQSAFSSYSTGDWEKLFSTRLQPFLFSIDAAQLTTILASVDCNGYAVVVRSLDSVFDDLSADSQKSLYGVLQDYLNKHSSELGACPVSEESSKDSSTRLFGKFIKFVAYTDLTNWIVNFDGLSAIDLLSPDQKANLAFSGAILTDDTKAEVFVNNIRTLSFAQLDIFLSIFQAIGDQNNIASLPNAQIQASLFSTIYGIVSQEFSKFSNEQWSKYFQYKFNLFLSSITESQVQQIPLSINCAAFRSVISGLSSHYNALNESAQTACFQYAKSYLTANKPASGPACPASAGGSGEWLQLNFALFSEIGTIEDIKDVYPGFIFTDAIAELTAEQLGYYVANGQVLSDKGQVSKVMGGITSATIEEFVDAFNKGMTMSGITQITNTQVKKFLLGEIFCKLGSILPSFTSNDFLTWFQDKLNFFISSIDARALGFISLDISCDSLASIMAPLNTVQNPENPDAIFNFAKSVLITQKASSHVACTSADLNSRLWLQTFFGKYSASGKWQDFSSLYPNFQVMEVTDLLTQVQLADASATSSIISNYTAVSTLLFSFSGSLDDFGAYLDTFQNYALKNPTLLSPKIKETILMAVADTLFPSVGSLSKQVTGEWLNKISFLLSAINSTMLGEIPLAISCDKYQLFVTAFDGVYNSLKSTTKQDIATFQKSFLLNKYTEEGDGCSLGSSSIASYIQNNIGLFCKQFTAAEVIQFNPAISEVSFTEFCSLS